MDRLYVGLGRNGSHRFKICPNNVKTMRKAKLISKSMKFAMSGTADIASQLSDSITKHSEEADRNRSALPEIIDCLKCCM